MRLANGVLWPMPITLDLSEERVRDHIQTYEREVNLVLVFLSCSGEGAARWRKSDAG